MEGPRPAVVLRNPGTPDLDVRIHRVFTRDRAAWGPRIQTLEGTATYPLGEDSFRIDHGADYFSFFDRLGSDLHYYVVADGDRALAVGAGVVRRVPIGGVTRECWYLCDLKVHPDGRGRRLPLRILSRGFVPGYWRCRRGYAVSMDPAGGEPNRIARLLGRFRWARLSAAATLRIYSLDGPAMRRAQPLVERHRGPTGFLSLAGVKEIVLASTGRPMPLLHVQFGPCADPRLREPQPGSVHMLCAPAGDPLATELESTGVRPSATATVIQHRMDDADWRFVLTSDI